MPGKYEIVPERTSRKRATLLAILGVVVLVGIIVIVFLAVRSSQSKKIKPLPVKKQKQLDPKVEVFEHAAVSADAPQCSVIGRDLLLKGGNAVDAIVGALFCAGVVNIHSTGIGGGGFSVIYDPKTKKSYAYDYRETAPENATERMFLQPGASSLTGGLAIAVPGEVKGLHTMWKMHGKLNWSDLVEPSRKLAADGFPFPEPVHEAAEVSIEKIKADRGLRALLLRNGELMKVGETLRNPELAKTLEIIRDSPFDFYNGSLAQRVLKDVQDAQGILSMKDLQSYEMAVREVYASKLPGDLTVHVMGPPSGGLVVSMILNILEGYNFNADDVATVEKKTSAIHKVIESFKFAYAQRSLLGDPSFVNASDISRVVQRMLDQSVADRIRINKIWLNQTHNNASYYGGFFGKDDFGTSHASVLDKDGMAVSSTSTINYYFGNGLRSLDTGIIYNNEMDDFSTPGKPNVYGYAPAPANYIAPGKRPLSSMAPAVITDNSGKVKMVVGAAGGSKIITAVAETIINKLFFNMDLGHAIVEPRYHHQLLPNVVVYEEKYPLAQQIIEGLEKRGHRLTASMSKAVVQGIFYNGTHIIGKADPRKDSISAGY